MGIYFSHSGISAELIKPGENKFRVKATAEVPSGIYEVRYIGAFGVSNPRPFSVGPLDELSSPGNNTSMAAAFAVRALSVVNGVAIARQSAWFRLPAKKDQRLLLRLSAEAEVCIVGGASSRVREQRESLRSVTADSRQCSVT